MVESFANLFEQHSLQLEMREGEVVDAIVVAVDHKYVTVTAGLKSEASISVNEFKDDKGEVEVKVGDVVKVAIEAIEDGYGETRLSRDKARRIAAWEELEGALTRGDVLNGMVYGRVKGGLGVMYKNVRLFLPGSLIDTRTVRDFAPYDNKEVEFKVIKVDRRRNNIVISRKAVLVEKTGEDSKAIIEKMQEGNVVQGIVKNITDYGAFVDLGGIDGLLYITDLSWKRVKHPSEVLSVGQEIEAKVLKFDQEKHRVSLGLKQLSNDPWVGIAERFPAGTRLHGKVSNLTDYGAFVELEPGIEGLVHVSEMDWTNKNVNPSKLVKYGDEIHVQILEIDADKRRISLGMKQCQANPWTDFADKFHKGDRVAGQIRSITDFGLFIGLDGGIDGLVHVSDISWTLSGDAAIRNYKKGQDVEAVIISVDVEKERIALGIKQLDNDPYAMFLNNNDKGAVVTGTVKEVSAEHATLELVDGIEAVLAAREASNERVDDLTKVLNVGDKLEVMITNIDRKSRVINVSVRAKDSREEADAVKKVRQAEKSSGTTNLGSLLQDKLSQG
ncbi:MAG: 30S ribosomal protein S1 [Burkholderiales bacterium]|nr:30S ribosomal protein S1 [Burkholderiales bacterium]MBP9769436.1 30S ribosomal protein S1 [Burkholderiales bacterium]MBX9867356.1 30S ribosomal protein S1 [Burkholderiales bacterium]